MKINKEVSQQASVSAKPQIYSLSGKDISVENSKIYRAAIRDKWDSVEAIFNDKKEKLTAKLSSSGDTALHIAVGTNRSHDFVDKIVKKIVAECGMKGLSIKNHLGDTALHVAARVGNVGAAKLLVLEDPRMVEATNNYKHMPLWVAAWGDDVDTLHYLLSATLKEDLEVNRNGFCSEPEDDNKFVHVCIKSGHYDVALYLLNKYPHLVWENHSDGVWTPLMCLASKPDAFRSAICLRYIKYYFHEFVYSCISVKEPLVYKIPAKRAVNDERPRVTEDRNDVDSSQNGVTTAVVPLWRGLLHNLMRFFLLPKKLHPWRCFWIIINLLPTCFRILGNYLHIFLLKVPYAVAGPYIKKVHNEKLRHKRAELLVETICSVLLEKAPDNINVCDVLRFAIRTAISNGCLELIEKCIEEYPGTIWCTDPEYSFLGLAIKHRQQKVFNLIYQMSSYKIHTLNHRDNLQNALHVAGELPPYHRLNTVTGPALQMQRELLWFQTVEKFSETSSLHFRNKNQKTPREVFTEQHKGLLRDAQEWTKGTSSSNTVVAALIVTITFAAMFTLPGGVNNLGKPQFSGEKLFQVFVFTDTAALFFSTTSVISFLSTLTCLSQEDFLSDVPWRLMCGFFSLFISLVATIVAYTATLVLVIHDEVQWIGTMVILTGCLPVILYSWLQFPLLLELVRATFGYGIFHKQKDLLVH